MPTNQRLRKTVLVVALIIMTLLLITSCDIAGNSLIGRWTNDTYYPVQCTLRFDSDGTVALYNSEYGTEYYSGLYEIDGDQIILASSGSTIFTVFSSGTNIYKISGDQLNINGNLFKRLK